MPNAIPIAPSINWATNPTMPMRSRLTSDKFRAVHEQTSEYNFITGLERAVEVGRVRIAIAGPGRSGTSLLVNLLAGWGFRTSDGPWYDDAAAGLEARLGSRLDLEVEKDPWAFEYIDRLDSAVLREYDAFIVPLRRRQDAAVSRAVRDRVQRALHHEGDEWQWDTWGVHAGGAIAATTEEAVASALGKGLWDLLDTVTAAGLQPIILHFPRFALDFDYLWAQLESVVGERIDKVAARAAWQALVDPSKIRIDTAGPDDPRIAELTAVVDGVRTAARRALLDNSALLEQLAQRNGEADQLQAEAERLHAEIERLHADVSVHDEQVRQHAQSAEYAHAVIDAMRLSRSWRLTGPLRALRRPRH